MIGHPSVFTVASLSLTKSIVSRHSPGEAGLGTMCTWLQLLATDGSITSSSSSELICLRISACLSELWARGGKRLRLWFHCCSIISNDISGTFAGCSRTVVEKISLNSAQSCLSFIWSAGEPSNVMRSKRSSGGSSLMVMLSIGCALSTISSS